MPHRLPRAPRAAVVGLLALVSLAPCLLGRAAAQATTASIRIKRPKLPAEQDTNSALAYFQFGNAVLQHDPERAGDAFYWAARLDPAWAAPLYGQYAAELLNQPTPDVRLYLVDPVKALRTLPRLQRIDSLARIARRKNPFVDRRLDGVIIATWVDRESGGEADLNDYAQYDRSFAGWVAFSRGDLKTASVIYDDELKKHPTSIYLLLNRADTYFAQGQMDSARMMIQRTLRIERTVETRFLGMGWVSHAFSEYTVGLLYGLEGKVDSAGASFEQALLDDMTLEPAHRALGRVRLAAHDTAAAVNEMVAAARLAPGDASTLFELGMLLMAARHPDSASTVLQQATTVEPWYAQPHYPLALLFESAGFKEEAIQHFTRFLQLAPRSMGPAIATARQHLAALAPAPAAP
jgi:tetratricopeptide (TPR) repeat protein